MRTLAMDRLSSVLVVVLGSAALVACASLPTSKEFTTLQPDKALDRGTQALATHAGGVASTDNEMGVITSKWQQHTDLEDNKYFYRTRVTIKRDDNRSARVQVNLDVQICHAAASLGAMDQQCERIAQVPGALAAKFQKLSASVQKAMVPTATARAQ